MNLSGPGSAEFEKAVGRAVIFELVEERGNLARRPSAWQSVQDR